MAIDERTLIARVESAGVEEFAQLLRRPSIEEERALRAHFGDERYQRLHARALKHGARRAARSPTGNVVVIHGIMGGELTAYQAAKGDQIWARPFALIAGRVARLRLADDARSELDSRFQVQATGIMKRAYGEILLALGERWNVRGFWYDWRKDLSLAAAELNTKIDGWFGPGSPVHLVAHSMGGLVARTFIHERPERWKKMGGGAGTATREGGRLVMLGTPNYGSYAIPQVMTGLEGMVKKLALLDIHHGIDELLPVFNSFVGSYQMLPSPVKAPETAWLYDAKAYGGRPISQHHLDRARAHHVALKDVIDPERMMYIAGFNQPTLDGIKSKSPGEPKAYTATRLGDGRVPHRLGLLEGVPSYYVEESHGDLPANDAVLAVLDELLETGKTDGLARQIPSSRGAASVPIADYLALQKAEVDRFAVAAQRTRTRGEDPTTAGQVSEADRELQENLTRGFLPSSERPARRAREADVPEVQTTIEIALIHGLIEDAGRSDDPALPVDAIAVGHYVGVQPQFAELALDKAISAAIRPNGRKRSPRPALGEPDNLILTQFTNRGIIRGELGQPFFLNDPRVTAGRSKGRLIAIAGMGMPGRFGTPELAVLARELCWALGRANCTHLATVLIGSGAGNIPTREAIGAWMRGIYSALAGSTQDERYRLRRVTFVDLDAAKIRDMDRALIEQKTLFPRLDIQYSPLSSAALTALERAEREANLRRWRARARKASAASGAPSAGRVLPTRITVTLDGSTYRFGAVADDAAIPEREVALDPALVRQANDELAGEAERESQQQRGEFLGKLLIPGELRPQLASDAPVVMTLDSTTARIHWEMVAYGAPGGGSMSQAHRGQADDFLGTSRGLTRQLRTTFAPPPEPPPPPRRTLRVLVVADPAVDAHLPGAEEEGAEVADLFESFNALYAAGSESRIEVVRLFGPTEATRTNVLRELMVKPYDILHFAGHCVFNKQQPSASGWLFSNGELLTANELSRIDRVPKFVFSNACESGVTPDRSERRTAELAPSFAEAFFARGVANFVCTAWPVDDAAAREFALRVYASLLGLQQSLDRPGRYELATSQPMYLAMREARRTLASHDYGARTWGAYQHYGNPYLKLFDDRTRPVARGTQQKHSGRHGTAANAKASRAKIVSRNKTTGQKQSSKKRARRTS